jgi:hypothetical protein
MGIHATDIVGQVHVADQYDRMLPFLQPRCFSCPPPRLTFIVPFLALR